MAGDIVAEKAAGTQNVASAFPFNPNKSAEYDPDAALAPPVGASVKPADPDPYPIKMGVVKMGSLHDQPAIVSALKQALAAPRR